MDINENNNTIIQETTFTRHSVLDTESEILNQVQDDEVGIMCDILFRYENTSKATDGVYFDMDGKEVNCEARETTLGCGLITNSAQPMANNEFRTNFPLKSPNHTYSKPRIAV